MADYKVRIILNDNSEAEYGVSNSAITPTTLPSQYSSTEYDTIFKILSQWVTLVSKANIKKLEIERE